MNTATTQLNMVLCNDHEYYDTTYMIVRDTWQDTHSAALTGDVLQDWIELHLEAEQQRGHSSLIVGTLLQLGLSQIEWIELAKDWIGRVAEQEYYSKHQSSIYDSEETGVGE